MLSNNNELFVPFTQRHAEIDRRNVWLYLFPTTIGNIFVVEMEKEDFSLETSFILNSYEKANNKFDSCVRKIIKEGKENN